jgi:hypothetical protein
MCGSNFYESDIKYVTEEIAVKKVGKKHQSKINFWPKNKLLKENCCIVESSQKVPTYDFHSLLAKYSVSHISIHPPDFSGNQGNHQNFEKSLLSYKC